MNSATTVPVAAPAPIRPPRLLGLYLLMMGLAAMLVGLPTLFNVAAVIAFGISVFLYGF